MMPRITRLQIDFGLCQACQPCKAAKVCRLKAIVQIDPGEPPYLEMSRCRDCRVCVNACPSGAVKQTG